MRGYFIKLSDWTSTTTQWCWLYCSCMADPPIFLGTIALQQQKQIQSVSFFFYYKTWIGPLFLLFLFVAARCKGSRYWYYKWDHAILDSSKYHKCVPALPLNILGQGYATRFSSIQVLRYIPPCTWSRYSSECNYQLATGHETDSSNSHLANFQTCKITIVTTRIIKPWMTTM